MIKPLLLVAFLSLIFSLGCNPTQKREPASINRPNHYVITMHGLRGDAATFGDFHSLIKPALEAIDPRYDLIPINWTYRVGNEAQEESAETNWNPHTIAQKFNHDFFLSSSAPLKNLSPQDRISIVTYSMGSLIAMNWYYDTLFNFEANPSLRLTPQNHQKLTQILTQVQDIIGLGGVYWGSVDAELGWTILESGNFAQLKRTLPKVERICQSQNVTQAIANSSSLFNPLNATQRREHAIVLATKKLCEGAHNLNTSSLFRRMGSLGRPMNQVLHRFISKAGNVRAQEIDDMRVTSDVLNQNRNRRMRHLLDTNLRTTQKTRWTSIVGVFPCLGNSDAGPTCRHFRSPRLQHLNEALITLCSGAQRREADGPVISPSAVADFIFYVESPGREEDPVLTHQFHDTAELQARSGVQNLTLFAENQHATVAPALESLGFLGSLISGEVLGFDAQLGNDVAIVDQNCANPSTCTHPNFKHVLLALAQCETTQCNDSILNRYYNVSDASQRLNESEQLQAQMGVYVLQFNIHLPQGFNTAQGPAPQLLQHIKFNYTGTATGAWEEQRLDQPTDPFIHQLARASEVMSSYAYVREKNGNKILRAYFVGRIAPKPGKYEQMRAAANQGITFMARLEFPGLKPRQVELKVKPTLSTYVDLYLH